MMPTIGRDASSRTSSDIKDSSDPSHFIIEINIGKSRIRPRTTLNLNHNSIWSRSRSSTSYFRVVGCRIATLSDIDFKNKMAWVRTTLKLGRENFKIYKSGVCLKLMVSGTFQVHLLMDYPTSINT